MRLLVVRHAVAERASPAQHRLDDEIRALTAEGRDEMRQVALGLKTQVPKLDLLATSPLLRALQTAEILAETYDGPAPVRVDALAPVQPLPALGSWVAGQRRHHPVGVVAVVGHEPNLSRATSWLLGGGDRSFLELKKGGACLLEFLHEVGPAQGTLLWSLTPGQLRGLGEGVAR